MRRKILLHIILWVGLTGLLLTSGLQYTHDVAHHSCSTSTEEQRDHADQHCSLCWFVSHQVLDDFQLASLVPTAQISLSSPVAEALMLVRFPDQVLSLKSNKDPPYTL